MNVNRQTTDRSKPKRTALVAGACFVLGTVRGMRAPRSVTWR